MLSLAALFPPILFVLLLAMATNRAFVFWQRERSQRTFYAMVVFVFFCLLFLASWWQWPTIWRDVVRVVLACALVLGNWHDWRYLFAFLHKKEDDALPHVDAHVTLGSLSETSGTAAIEASEKPTTDEKDSKE